MEIPFELHVALRYLLAKRKQAFISVISFISTLGVAVGVMAVIIALAVMTGLQQELRDRILGSNPHIYVWKASGIVDYRAEAEIGADFLRYHERLLGPELVEPAADAVGSKTRHTSRKSLFRFKSVSFSENF